MAQKPYGHWVWFGCDSLSINEMVSYPASRRNLSILFAMFESAKAEAKHPAAKSFIFSDQKATFYEMELMNWDPE